MAHAVRLLALLTAVAAELTSPQIDSHDWADMFTKASDTPQRAGVRDSFIQDALGSSARQLSVSSGSGDAGSGSGSSDAGSGSGDVGSGPPPSSPPSPIYPGGTTSEAASFNLIFDQDCNAVSESYKDQLASAIKAATIKDLRQYSSVYSSFTTDDMRVLWTCGSLQAQVLFVNLAQGQGSVLVSALNIVYPLAQNSVAGTFGWLNSALQGYNLIGTGNPYATFVVNPKPPAAPPAPPPQCTVTCDVYVDGGSPTMTSMGFMCTKREYRHPNFVTVCKPKYELYCPGDYQLCHLEHAPNNGLCLDTPGKWATKKCRKKVQKNKCHKKKAARNCGLTCGTCQGNHNSAPPPPSPFPPHLDYGRG